MFSWLARLVLALEGIRTALNDLVDLQYQQEGLTRPNAPEPAPASGDVMITTDAASADAEAADRSLLSGPEPAALPGPPIIRFRGANRPHAASRLLKTHGQS